MTVGKPKFHIDPDAVRYIVRNGGSIYIWSEAGGGSLGLVKASPERPLRDITFTRYHHDGIELHVDEAIPPPGIWCLSFHRWPHRYVRADSDRATAGAS